MTATAKKKIPKSTRTVYVRNVPENLHGFFKAACAKRGVSIQQQIIDLMREYVKKESI